MRPDPPGRSDALQRWLAAAGTPSSRRASLPGAVVWQDGPKPMKRPLVSLVAVAAAMIGVGCGSSSPVTPPPDGGAQTDAGPDAGGFALARRRGGAHARPDRDGRREAAHAERRREVRGDPRLDQARPLRLDARVLLLAGRRAGPGGRPQHGAPGLLAHERPLVQDADTAGDAAERRRPGGRRHEDDQHPHGRRQRGGPGQGDRRRRARRGVERHHQPVQPGRRLRAAVPRGLRADHPAARARGLRHGVRPGRRRPHLAWCSRR